jgi:hypothetical protein
MWKFMQRLARPALATPLPPGRGRAPCSCPPRLEILEDRLAPGDVLFGPLLGAPWLEPSLWTDGLTDSDSRARRTHPASSALALDQLAVFPLAPAVPAPSGVSPDSPQPLRTDGSGLGEPSPPSHHRSPPKPIAGGITATFGDESFFIHHYPPVSGNEPSTIGDFRGVVANARISGTGTGTGFDHPLTFQADMTVMQGTYIGVDGRHHQGTFGFV